MRGKTPPDCNSQKTPVRRFIGVPGTLGKCTYLLPIRRPVFSEKEANALADYFRILCAAGCEVLVIDGSLTPVFAAHGRVWSPFCRHEPVDRRFGYLNDKVNGVHTGVALAMQSQIILADDDIRYDPRQIAEICGRLQRFDVVRPQNFLQPLPWWALMEASRMLINRATLRAADYPGTCAFRREAMLLAGEYDGDVLFDNEEIIRHFICEGLSINYANDLFVRKNAPPFRKWLEQRARQAYEDFPLRVKTIIFASVLPLALLAWALGGFKAFSFFVVVLGAGSMTLAVLGRARGGARDFFPRRACAFAPLWIVERALSTYWAIGWFLLRGGYPFGERLLRKGVGRDWFAAAQSRGA